MVGHNIGGMGLEQRICTLMLRCLGVYWDLGDLYFQLEGDYSKRHLKRVLRELVIFKALARFKRDGRWIYRVYNYDRCVLIQKGDLNAGKGRTNGKKSN